MRDGSAGHWPFEAFDQAGIGIASATYDIVDFPSVDLRNIAAPRAQTSPRRSYATAVTRRKLPLPVRSRGLQIADVRCEELETWTA